MFVGEMLGKKPLVRNICGAGFCDVIMLVYGSCGITFFKKVRPSYIMVFNVDYWSL